MTFEDAFENIGEIVYCFRGGEAAGKLVGVRKPDRMGWFDILVQYAWGGQMWEPGWNWSLYSYDEVVIGPSDKTWMDDGF